jgi:UDP-2,3-diacylglucosamine hydrolase
VALRRLAVGVGLGYFCGTVAASYFISDVHLGVESPDAERAKEQRLIERLTRFGADAERIYILGDLFDFWFEYRYAVPTTGQRVLSAFRALCEQGVDVHYLAGNHDFALGPYLSQEIGCILHLEPFEAEIEGTRFMLHHGDGLAARDLGYRILRGIVRNRVSQAMWRWVHPDIGLALARRVSRASRGHTGNKNYGPGDPMEAGLRKLAEGGFDFLIVGHTHVADVCQLTEQTTCINLGSWLEGGAPYARFESGVLEVIRPDGAALLLGEESNPA